MDYGFFQLIGNLLKREGVVGVEVRLKSDVQGQRGWKILDIPGQGGWVVFKVGPFSWTSYVYCP